MSPAAAPISSRDVHRKRARPPQSCYNELKDGEIIALAEVAVRKSDLKRKKNDEQAEVNLAYVVQSSSMRWKDGLEIKSYCCT